VDVYAALYILIRRFEGLRLRAYYCPAGVLTCGYGSTGRDIKPGTVWTKEYAEARMQQDALKFSRGAKVLCPAASGTQLCALADFAYNLGLGNLKSSTLRRKINAGDIEGAKKQIMRWNKGGGKVLAGLTKRRTLEASLL
jgi:lysozyme